MYPFKKLKVYRLGGTEVDRPINLRFVILNKKTLSFTVHETELEYQKDTLYTLSNGHSDIKVFFLKKDVKFLFTKCIKRVNCFVRATVGTFPIFIFFFSL